MTSQCRIDTELSLSITTPGRIAVSVAVAGAVDLDAESFTVSGSAATDAPRVVAFPERGRTHVLEVTNGSLDIRYQALRDYQPTEPATVSEVDSIRYSWPSRYCPSDRVSGLAAAEFGHLASTREKIDAIVEYVGRRLFYLAGSTGPTEDAIDILLAGQGVCRDYAHLCVMFCRALSIPARFVSVYAPGLSPMDFHAVFEARLYDQWWVFDATGLAPRSSMTRIATGRDAADTAFVTTLGAAAELLVSNVTVTAEPTLPRDDPAALIALH